MPGEKMACLPQLLEPDRYRPCDWDLRTDDAGRAYWIDLFRWHLDAVLVPLIRAQFPAKLHSLPAFRSDYLARFEAIARYPSDHGRVDVLHFTVLREASLRQFGFDDPFRGVKQRETDAALGLLPAVLAELDAAAPRARAELLVRGLLAGNVFDLGSRATIEQHRAGVTAFHTALASLPARPWLVDQADAWFRRWEQSPPYRHVAFFVDNAGGDLALGCLPLVRWMLRHKTRVTLAANSGPALNDITASELGALLTRCAPLDADLARAIDEGRLAVRATGSTTPLLDLMHLEGEFVAAVADADLILLHGMGRAIESNFHARFSCDVLRTAVLKDERVAARLNGRLFDCVFRFPA